MKIVYQSSAENYICNKYFSVIFFLPDAPYLWSFAPPAVRLIMSEPPLNEKIKTHANALSAMPDDKR